jgi:hypothetical protein
MRRGAKPAKAKVETRRPVARKPSKNEASGRRELEQRLAESLEREKATGEILQEKDRALTEALESSRRRQARSCASSRARRRTFSPFLTPS